MLPIFKEYNQMLETFNVDLSAYDKDKLWVDRLIIRGFDKDGKNRKICRLKVIDNLTYEHKFYDNLPKNKDLETWEESYLRLESEILEREGESINVIQNYLKDNIFSKILVANSMGKDSKLVEYIVNKSSPNCEYINVFNNTTLDCADVYKEAKEKKCLVITPKTDDGKIVVFIIWLKNMAHLVDFQGGVAIILKRVLRHNILKIRIICYLY